MKAFLLVFTCLFSVLQASHEVSKLEELAPQTKEAMKVKILIKESIDGALIDVSSGYTILNPQNGKTLSSSLKGKRYYLQANEDGLKWGEGFPGIHQFTIVPKDPNASILIDGIQYKGSVEVYEIHEHIHIVNEVDAEDFLRANLSFQFGSSDYLQATYEAIAIASRTDLYSKVLRSNSPFYHFSAKEVNYQGNSTAMLNPGIDQAVLATKELIMIYQDQPFATSWTENSAGRTATFDAIYRKKIDAPPGVTVAYAQKMRPQNHWKCTLTNQELAKLLGLSRIKGIDLFQDPSSQKVYALRVTDGRTFREYTIFEFRELLGKTRLISNDFSVHLIKDFIEFEGFGQGYGVGICLFSADQMARLGDNALQILLHFYPSTRLIKIGAFPKGIDSSTPEGTQGAEEDHGPPESLIQTS